jgi:hypothetical protein
MALAAAAALLAPPACTDFDDPTTVIDLRVLAVKTEPSEIILDVDLTDPTNPIVNPASNLPVTVTPLIVNASGEITDATFTIIGCPNNPFAAAPPMGGGGGGGMGFPSGGARTTVGSAPCDRQGANTAELQLDPVTGSVDVHPTEAALKAAFLADIFPDQYRNLHGGFDLGEPYVLTLGVEGAGEQLTVIKRVLYWAGRINDAHVPNLIPTITRLDTFAERDPQTSEPVGDRTELVAATETTPAMTVPAGSTLWIEPAAATAESYQTRIIDATTHLAVPLTIERETIRYAFYATAGSFQPARTASELPPGFVNTGRVHIESEYSAPREVPADPLVHIWVVARDDRGGEHWIARTIQIVAAP